MAGIDKTLETFSDLSKLSVDVIAVIKSGGITFGSLPKILSMVSEISELMKDAPAALPELQDLDMNEAGQVGAAAFALVKSVIQAVAA